MVDRIVPGPPKSHPLLDSDPLLLSIKSTSFGAVGAIINFVVAYFVSNATEDTPEDIQELVESIRIPKGAGAATGH